MAVRWAPHSNPFHIGIIAPASSPTNLSRPPQLPDEKDLISIRLVYSDAEPQCDEKCVEDGMWGAVKIDEMGHTGSALLA